MATAANGFPGTDTVRSDGSTEDRPPDTRVEQPAT
jgi:hypothetical protein